MPDRKITPKRGDRIEIVFLDHSQDYGTPIEIEAFGRVVSIDRISLTIVGWRPTDPEIAKTLESNSVIFTILRSTVKSLEVLEPRKTRKS